MTGKNIVHSLSLFLQQLANINGQLGDENERQEGDDDAEGTTSFPHLRDSVDRINKRKYRQSTLGVVEIVIFNFLVRFFITDCQPSVPSNLPS